MLLSACGWLISRDGKRVVSIAALAERTALDYSRCGGSSARVFLGFVDQLAIIAFSVPPL
jgi:hypothetical protein